MRLIRCSSPNAADEMSALLRQLSAQGTVVSARGRELTKKVFGEELPPAQVVERICTDVRTRGLESLLLFTRHFDGVELTPEMIRVSADELRSAHAGADHAFLTTVRHVRHNVMSFQSGLLSRDYVLQSAGHHELRMRYRPMRRVGVMIPGGAAAYPSTLLMTVCPARAAGVKEIAVAMPPTPNGAYNRDLLAVCHELGIGEVYRVGGAQAVAALAYGVEGMPGVDMIVGPGNLFVSLAKRHVFGQVAIDCLAGPSEIVVLADESASPEYIAADLIAQAEHSPGASLLVTWHEALIPPVEAALERQLERLPRGQLARESLQSFGAILLAENEQQAIDCTDRIAPEHLHIVTRDPQGLAQRIDNAGAIFLGDFSPVALGDYVAGPSHVLPTGATARFASGLCANDFLRRSSVIRFTRQGLERMAEDVNVLAAREGLTAHVESVNIRLRQERVDSALHERG
jgi:histidinol dehydrogenase